MSANALRDLARIQKLRQRRGKKEANDEQDKANRKIAIDNAMKFVVDTLKNQPNNAILGCKMGDLLQGYYSKNKTMPPLKHKALLKRMTQKNLIGSELGKNAAQKFIKLIGAEERVKISLEKQEKRRWWNVHQKTVEELEQWIIKILNGPFANDNTMSQVQIGRLLKENYGKSLKELKKLFNVPDVICIWRRLQNHRRVITFEASLDQKQVQIKLNEEFVEIKQPPFKKAKIESYINKFNEGEINEEKLTKKILKQMDKLNKKSEIHFHFKLDRQEGAEDLSDSEMSSSSSD